MNLDQLTEKKLKEYALFYMKQARPDFNVPHFYAAVFYMKKLIKVEKGDKKILLPAIYLHDIGYAGMLSGKYTFEDNKKVKGEHMVVGAIMSQEILKKLNVFSKDEIRRICYLVKIHDNLLKIKGHEAQLVFEADSLAQIDRDRVKPNFDKESYKQWLDDFLEKRVPLFKTKTGNKFLNKLLPKTKSYFS